MSRGGLSTLSEKQQTLVQSVLEFYREIFAPDVFANMTEGFQVAGLNTTFTHCVLNPNFFIGRDLTEEVVEASRAHFVKGGARDPHWINLFDYQRLELEQSSPWFWQAYTPELDVTYNFFTRPLNRGAVPGVRIEAWDSVPPEQWDTWLELTTENSIKVDPDMLNRIRWVFEHSTARLHWYCAYDREDKMIGSFLAVRGVKSTLVVLAWVDKPWRKKGVIGHMFTELTRNELREPGRCVFYWTLNQHLTERGDELVPLTIYREAATWQPG